MPKPTNKFKKSKPKNPTPSDQPVTLPIDQKIAESSLSLQPETHNDISETSPKPLTPAASEIIATTLPINDPVEPQPIAASPGGSPVSESKINASSLPSSTSKEGSSDPKIEVPTAPEMSTIQVKSLPTQMKIKEELPSGINNIFPEIPHLRQGLRIKLTLVSLVPLLLVSGVGIFLHWFQVGYLFLAIFTLSLLPIILVWFYLHPLEKIYRAIYSLIKKQGALSLSVRTGDEFEDISNILNQLSQDLNLRLERVENEDFQDKSQKSRLSVILSAVQTGLIVVDKEKNILLANEKAEKLTGYVSSEMIGHPVDDIISLADKTGQHLKADEYCNLNSTEGVYENPRPLSLLDKNGGQTYVILKSNLIHAKSEPDLGALVVLEDVSKQKDLETMEIDFVSMTSHELRTPLTSIKGYLSVFLQENKDKLTKEQREFLDRVYISAQQLSGLVDNILSVAKVERGAVALSTETLPIDSLLSQSVHDNALQADKKNIKLNYEKAPNVLVAVDKVRITEVINNLIANAINYTQEGGQIDVSSRIDGQTVVASVKDSGRGLSADSLEHLFTKFFRVQGALDMSSNSHGTGLGLYLSKSIISLHKGKIWAESEGLGKGSTFCFSLPIAEKVSIKNKLAPLDIKNTLET